MTTIADFSAARSDGTLQPLADYRGRVLLIVNTASQCGYTPQFGGLQTLYERYQARGLTVLGFPCNQFARQDPGSDTEIAGFCQVNYGVTFPMFAKIDVNGPNAHPLYRWLKAEAPGVFGSRSIKWNFTKFLVDREGRVVARFATLAKPENLATRIEASL